MNIDPKSKQLICDLDQLQSLAQNLASKIQTPYCIELTGDLGGGKTTFVKFLGKSLGIEQTIISPTFAIHQTYKFSDVNKLEHFDLYRVSRDPIIENELHQAVNDQNSLTVIEWATAEIPLPKNHLIIEFDYVDESHRKLILRAAGILPSQLLDMIK